MNQFVSVSSQSESSPSPAAVAEELRKSSLRCAAVFAVALAAFALHLLLDMPPWVSKAAMAATFPIVMFARTRLALLGLTSAMVVGLGVGGLGASYSQVSALSLSLPVVAMLAAAWYATSARQGFSTERGFLIASLAVLLVASLVAPFLTLPVFWVLPSTVGTLLILSDMFRVAGIRLKTGTSG